MARGSPLFSLIAEQYNPSTRSEKSSPQHNFRIFITFSSYVTQYAVIYIVTEAHNLIELSAFLFTFRDTAMAISQQLLWYIFQVFHVELQVDKVTMYHDLLGTVLPYHPNYHPINAPHSRITRRWYKKTAVTRFNLTLLLPFTVSQREYSEGNHGGIQRWGM